LLYKQAEDNDVRSNSDSAGRSGGAWLFLPIAAIIAFEIWGSVHQGQGYFHIIWSPLALGMGVIVILQIIGYARSGSLPNMTQFTFFSILMISAAAAAAASPAA
jgi:hypothetical protein